MVNPAEHGTLGGAALVQRPASDSPVHSSFHGRPVSWVAVSIITAGFLAGGAGLVFGQHGPTWWLFWVGCGLTGLGILLCIATNTFDDWY